MESLTLKNKLFIPIGIAFTLVIGGFIWYFITTQNNLAEQAHENHLTTLASSARFMIHSTAEEYVAAQGLKFHRVALGTSASGSRSKPEAEAVAAFASSPKLDIYMMRELTDSGTTMHVYSVATLQPECHTCHDAYGIDTFKDRKDGEQVALFGVSGSMEALYAEQARTRWFAIAIGLVVLFALRFIVNGVTGRTVLSSVHELAMQSNHVAEGDLRVIATPELDRRMNSPDEIGSLARSFGGMISGLRNLVRRVGTSAHAVAESGRTIGSTTEQLAAAASEQSSQTNEVASAVEEMARTIIENSRNATKAADTAQRARETAERGGEVVEKTVAGMRRISDVVHSSARIVHALGNSGDQIGEIIAVIEDIADQTNLLALNAAIEAARAGEQGRGFAVVADEVRKLAERTTKATREIAAMIKRIQTDTAGAVKSMEEGTIEVEAGIVLADKAGSSLREIVETTKEVTDVIGQIAAASEEQSTTAEQISKNIEAINSVSQESANGTQQIARAADELRQLTEDLQGVIAQFRLSENGGSEAHTGEQPVAQMEYEHAAPAPAPERQLERQAVGSSHASRSLERTTITSGAGSLLAWRPEYSVGIHSIDTQHRRLIDLINLLHDSMKAGSGRETLEEVLTDLLEYTKYHFAHEEQAFRDTRYPETKAHKAEHDKLAKQVVRIVKEFRSGKVVLSMDVLTFLKEWLQNHILKVDKAYTGHLSANGVR